ncbi:MAG: hypothetical protein IPP77_05020 [Bacteroidetes bacterium]|nr:hypothetical protein [Bacteroidota bacterium]
MKKLTLLYAAFITMLAIGAASYYFLSFPTVFDAMPSSCVAVLQVNNWSQFEDKLGTTYTGLKLKKAPVIQKLLNQVNEIHELLEDKIRPEWQFNSGKTVAAVHLISADNYDFLFASSVRGLGKKELLQNIRSKKTVSSVNERVFKGEHVLDIVLKDGKILTLVETKGLIAISFTSFLVENSIKAIQSGDNIEDDKSFMNVRKKFVPSGDLSLFFNFQKAEVILPVAFKETKVAMMNSLHQFADWGAYNLTLTNQELVLTGLAYSAGDARLTTPKNSDGPKDPFLTTVPDNAAYFVSGRIENTNQQDPIFSKKFEPWIGEKQALVILESLEENINNQSLLILQVKNIQQAKANLLQSGAAKIEALNETGVASGAEIFSYKNGDLLNNYFGKGLIAWDQCYFSFVQGSVIFSQSPNTLNFVFDKIDSGQILIKTTSFSELQNQIKKETNILVYINPTRAEMLLQGLLKNKSSVTKYLMQFGEIMIGSEAKDGWVTSTGIFRTGGEKRTSPGVLWRTALETLSDFAPQIVLNATTLEKEIFTQDTAGNIYLLNKGGEILFTKNIHEAIIGEVQQLDYYNNGKMQYVFNSATHVFMIDRFGNDVASYPLRLSRTATAGLTLVNDPSSKSYRYYIPCDNGGVYGYESTGRPVSGWSPRAMAGRCTKPLQYIRNKEGGYFLAYTEDGKLLLIDEKGKLMWSINNLPDTKQNFSIVAQGDDIILLNAAGKELTEISWDGNDRIKPLMDSANSFTATATSDSSYLYFFSTRNEIRAYDGKGGFKNSNFIKDAHISSIEVVYIAAEKHLLVKDESASKVYIYDLALEFEGVLSLSNMASATVADLLDRNEFIAITGDRKGNIVCTRIR